MKTLIFLAGPLIAASLAACSSEGDVLPKRGGKPKLPAADAGEVLDAAPDAEEDVASDVKPPRDPNANCIKPGTPRNDRDIGGYCEPGRGDCNSPLGARFCTADYRDLTPIEDDKWFCSAICTTNEECGTAALCAEAPGGGTRGCVPFVCYGDGGGVPQGEGR